jgi:hypothetical protein
MMRRLFDDLLGRTVPVVSAAPLPYRPQLPLADGHLLIEPRSDITLREAVELRVFLDAMAGDPRARHQTVAWATTAAEGRGFAQHVRGVVADRSA